MIEKTAPVIYEKSDPELIGYLGETHVKMAKKGLDSSLSALIELRSSQINQCAFCVNMHLNDARKSQVSQSKLDKLIVWRHVEVFSPKERAVLAWTEALTVLDQKTDYASLRAELREHFTDHDITLITADIGMINLWNRVQISKH